MKSAHPKQVQDDNISPLSSVQATPVLPGAQMAAVSPAEPNHPNYFPDEKIVMPIEAYEGIEAIPRRPSRGLEATGATENPPSYTVGGAQVGYANADAELPARPAKKPFWKRHFLWILTIAILLVIFITTVAGLLSRPRKTKEVTVEVSKVVTNSTLYSVASSGLFLKDGTWNMHLFSQNHTGGITLQVSLDGESYEPYQNVSLTIPPKVGSPLSATAEQDPQTGVVMVRLLFVYQHGMVY
jgi:hypothetical protein